MPPLSRMFLVARRQCGQSSFCTLSGACSVDKILWTPSAALRFQHRGAYSARSPGSSARPTQGQSKKPRSSKKVFEPIGDISFSRLSVKASATTNAIRAKDGSLASSVACYDRESGKLCDCGVSYHHGGRHSLYSHSRYPPYDDDDQFHNSGGYLV